MDRQRHIIRGRVRGGEGERINAAERGGKGRERGRA